MAPAARSFLSRVFHPGVERLDERISGFARLIGLREAGEK